MIVNKKITLLFDGQEVEAEIVNLTTELADAKVLNGWWDDESLKNQFDEDPIDVSWDWHKVKIEYEGHDLASEKLAVITGEGEDLAVQGIMLLSTTAIPSHLEEGGCLLLELLFTAPWNRQELRKDGQPFLTGVGLKLLMFAAEISRNSGQDGRIRLDASPDSIDWYKRRGLQTVKLAPNVWQGVTYTPPTPQWNFPPKLPDICWQNARRWIMTNVRNTDLTRQLPKGLKAATSKSSPQLRREMAEPDIKTSGGTNTVIDGQRVLGRQVVH